MRGINDIDPDEIVRFGDRDMTLRRAVEFIMGIEDDFRVGVIVIRGVGRKPTRLDAQAIEQFAQMPGFVEGGADEPLAARLSVAAHADASLSRNSWIRQTLP